MSTKMETLDQRAERLAAETAEVHRQQQALAAEQARRLVEHQAAYDKAVIDNYDRAALDQAVADAKAALDQAIADHSLTRALAADLCAQYARYAAFEAVTAALGRMGRATDSMLSPTPGTPDLLALIVRAAERVASDQLDGARAARDADRSTLEETTGQPPRPSSTRRSACRDPASASRASRPTGSTAQAPTASPSSPGRRSRGASSAGHRPWTAGARANRHPHTRRQAHRPASPLPRARRRYGR